MKLPVPGNGILQWQHIHFIGIGGVTMAGLAELLHARGKRISGSELRANEHTRRLAQLGIPCVLGPHSLGLTPSTEVAVVSPRVPRTHPDLQRAAQWGIPVVRVAQMLGALSAVHTTIAIAGCHGKTTVGAYLGTVLEKAGHDPSVLLRSPVEVWHHNVRCGKGKHLIVEADENERRFLSLTPAIGVITNIEADHLDYFKDLDAIIRAYHQFARITCRTGVLIANHDDANVVAALKGVRGEIIWFGAGEGVQVRAMNIKTGGTVTSFLLHIKRGEHDLQFDLSVPGVYQINNALAVAAVCHYLTISMEPVREALSAYHGGLRHMELRGETAHLAVIDDAADHPSEIKAVLAALRRQYPGRKIYAAYQPYLLNRSRMLAESLAQAFTDADEVWVCPIMPGAEETAIPFTHHDLVTRIAQFHTHVLPFISIEDVVRACNASDTPAVMITLGADPVRGIGDEFLKRKNGSAPL